MSLAFYCDARKKGSWAFADRASASVMQTVVYTKDSVPIPQNFQIILSRSQTETLNNHHSTFVWYENVRLRLLLASQIRSSSSIRIHIPHRRFDRGGFLQYFDANHTRWVVSGAPPVWHVSSVIAGKQQKNFSLGQNYPEELG